MLKFVANKLSIPMGMSALEKFIYNIDAVSVAGNSYRHIPKSTIDDAYLDASAIFVDCGGDKIMFGSTAVHFTQQESPITRRPQDEE